MHVTILLSVLITSMLSGVLGMGGGMLLMGLFTLLLPTGAAMTLHGLAQLAANGSRTVLHGRHVQWSVLPFYAAGALAAFGLFRVGRLVPQDWVIYVLMGLMPWFAVYGRRFMVLDIEKRSHAISCGFLVCLLQLASGVSGPALDIFYVHTRLSRHKIVATKAMTQTLGHGLKIIHYGSIAGATQVSIADGILIAMTALLGTVVGGRFLDQTNDASFQLWSRRILLVIGTFYLGMGLFRFLQSSPIAP